MRLVLVTAPASEPVTLDEAKLHLRIDGEDEDEYVAELITAAREAVEHDASRALLTQVWDYRLPAWPSGDRIKLPLGNLQSVLSLTIADSACVEANGTYDLIFTGDNTTPATGTYTIDTNVITAVSLTNGGTGYVTAPTVATESGDGSVTAALASVTWKDDEGTVTTLVPGTDFLLESNGNQCGFVVLPYAETWPSGTLYPSNPITIRFACGWPNAASVPYVAKAATKLFMAALYEGRGEDIIGQTVSPDRERYFSLIEKIPRLHDRWE